jgi:hypothetical protein
MLLSAVGASGMSRPRSLSFLYGAIVACLHHAIACAAELETLPPPSDEPVLAVWKAQEVTFYFQSFTTFYSCSSLETKVKRLLVAVGAHRDLKVRTRGCMSSNAISRMPHVEIKLLSPVEATPEALAEFDKTRSTRELAARVRGDAKLAQLAEEQFPAQWQRVSLSRGKLNLEPGDCELIDQLKKKVLPKLAIRVVDDGVECVPNQISMSQPKLIVDALAPMAKPDEPAPADNKAKEKT